MKTFFNILCVFFVLATTSCQQEDNLQQLAENPSPAILKNEFQQGYTLNKSEAETPFETLSWSKADYGVPTEVSYTVEVATNERFENPQPLLTVSGETSVVVTVGTLNTVALASGISMDGGQLFFQLKSEMLDDTGMPQESSLQLDPNIHQCFVKPYASQKKVIYKVGDSNGWDDYSLTLSEEEPGIFEGEFDLQQGKKFKLLPEKGDWDNEISTENTTITSPDLLVDNESNFDLAGENGRYKMVYNQKEQSIGITLISATDPTITKLFKVGDKLGEDDRSEVLLPATDQVFQGEFTMKQGEQFSFEADLEGTDIIDATKLTILANSPLVKSANNHFEYTGAEGAIYKFTVDLKANTIQLEEKEVVVSKVLYLVGDRNSWTPDPNGAIAETENGLFEFSVDFTAWEKFKFLKVLDNWDDLVDANSFTIVGTDLLKDYQDNGNFTYASDDASTQTVIINTTEKTITLKQ